MEPRGYPIRTDCTRLTSTRGGVHHGLEFREIPIPSPECSVGSPFDAVTTDSQPVRESSQPRVEPPLPSVYPSSDGDVLLVPANNAYGLYLDAAIYCCPVTMRNLAGVIPDRIAFYAKGVKREIPRIRGVVDISISNVAECADAIRAAGRDPMLVEHALRRWSAWGADRGGHSYDRARVALLSAPGESDLLLLSREIPAAVGAGKGHQSSLVFHLNDLRNAGSFDELRSMRQERRKAGG